MTEELERIAKSFGACCGGAEACQPSLVVGRSRLGEHGSENPQVSGAAESLLCAVNDSAVTQASPCSSAPAATVSFPCLSLASHAAASSNDRSAIKMHAAALLARPVVVSTSPARATTLHNDSSSIATNELQHAPSTLLENLYSSFDILVDARIRVYSRILSSHGQAMLSQHGQNMASCNHQHQPGEAIGDGKETTSGAGPSSLAYNAIKYKLKTLLEIGGSFSADSVSTKFAVLGEATETTASTTPSSTTEQQGFPKTDAAHKMDEEKGDNDEKPNLDATKISSTNQAQPQAEMEPKAEAELLDCAAPSSTTTTITLPLHFEARIRALRVGNRSINLSFQTQGSITGTFGGQGDSQKTLSNVSLDIDTSTLLSAMMEEATRVVSVLVEVTNDAWSQFVVDTMLVPTMDGDCDDNDATKGKGRTIGGSANASTRLPSSQSRRVDGSSSQATKDSAASSPSSSGDGTRKRGLVSGMPCVVTETNLQEAASATTASSQRQQQQQSADTVDTAALQDDTTKHANPSAMETSSSGSISSLVSEEESIGGLDAQKCANIVDFVMDDVDDNVLHNPITKKRRV